MTSAYKIAKNLTFKQTAFSSVGWKHLGNHHGCNALSHQGLIGLNACTLETITPLSFGAQPLESPPPRHPWLLSTSSRSCRAAPRNADNLGWRDARFVKELCNLHMKFVKIILGELSSPKYHLKVAAVSWNWLAALSFPKEIPLGRHGWQLGKHLVWVVAARHSFATARATKGRFLVKARPKPLISCTPTLKRKQQLQQPGPNF